MEERHSRVFRLREMATITKSHYGLYNLRRQI
jgi:hypothetical protein